MGDFTYHIVQVRVLFRCRQGKEQKQLTFFRYMDVTEPLDSTEDLLGCVVLHWSTNNDVKYAYMQVVLNPKEPPAPWNDIVDFENIKSVV